MQLPKRKPGKYAEDSVNLLMSEEKFHELEKELKELKKKQPIAAEEVRRCAENGDFSENAEYQAAKRRLRGIITAITRLEFQVDHAEVIQRKRKGFVELGSTVTLRINGKEYTYQILGSLEANPEKGIISQDSPIGQALIGKKVGEKFILQIGKKDVEYEVLKVE
ncbi:MAG: GreA/GreB family elongation factor [Candidatus Magasanikbacteria bacterium]